MNLKDLCDEELFQKYVDGDAHSFRIFYGRLSPRVWSFVKKRVKDSGLAEDIFQEVWIKVHRSRAHYKPALPVLPWIFTITRSVLIDRMRSASVNREIPSDPVDLEGLTPVGFETVGGDSRSLDETMQGLSALDRDLLEKRYLKEWSFEELAKEARVDPQTLRKRISRLLQRVRLVNRRSER